MWICKRYSWMSAHCILAIPTVLCRLNLETTHTVFSHLLIIHAHADFKPSSIPITQIHKNKVGPRCIMHAVTSWLNPSFWLLTRFIKNFFELCHIFNCNTSMTVMTSVFRSPCQGIRVQKFHPQPSTSVWKLIIRLASLILRPDIAYKLMINC